jgi:tRNA(Ile)-lysidine synthase
MGYLEERHIEYRIDDSNTDTRYLRNQVRHDLIPALTAEFNPKLPEALIRLAEVQRAENKLVDEIVAEFLGRCFEAGRIKRDAFARGVTACQRRGLIAIAWRYGVECPFERVEAARAFLADGPAGRSFDLGGGVSLRNARDLTDIVRGTPARDECSVTLVCPGETHAFDSVFRVRFPESVSDVPLAQYCTPSRQVFDADAATNPFAVRFRRPGDRFMPLGMGGTKKVKDYFVDAGVPATDRDRIPLLVCGDRIAWVVGYAMSAEFAVTQRTMRLVEVEVWNATE